MRSTLRHITLSLLLLVVGHSALAQGFDYRVLRTIQQHRTPAMDRTMTFVSNTLVLVPVAPATQLVAGAVGSSPVLKLDALQTATAIGIDECATALLKNTVRRPRPYVAYADSLLPVHTTVGFSFPSGHSSLAFATAVSLSLQHPRWYVVAPSVLWATAVAYSRLYLGVHYPSDVLVGAVLGATAAYVSHLCYRQQRAQLGLPQSPSLVLPLTINF